MTGSITKRQGKRGVSYRLRYYVTQADGSRIQRSETCRTKKEAEARLSDVVAELRSGTYTEPSDETVGVFLTRWLGSLSGTVRDSTLAGYGFIVNTRAIPSIGAIRLRDLSPEHLQRWLAELTTAGYATSTIRLSHTVLRRALNAAVRWRVVPRNVARDVTPPAAERNAARTWTAEEARRFLESSARDPFATLWRLALDSGMRIGELLALNWDDVDFDRGTVAVRRTVTRNRDAKWIIGDDTKTRSGRRLIALTPSTAAALRRHRTDQLARRLAIGPAWVNTGLVFDGGDGALARPETVRYGFLRAVRLADVPSLTFHGLRHTCATLLLASGVHPKVVQERLGHASIAITLDRYSHVTMDMQSEAASALDRLLSGAS